MHASPRFRPAGYEEKPVRRHSTTTPPPQARKAVEARLAPDAGAFGCSTLSSSLTGTASDGREGYSRSSSTTPRARSAGGARSGGASVSRGSDRVGRSPTPRRRGAATSYADHSPRRSTPPRGAIVEAQPQLSTSKVKQPAAAATATTRVVKSTRLTSSNEMEQAVPMTSALAAATLASSSTTQCKKSAPLKATMRACIHSAVSVASPPLAAITAATTTRAHIPTSASTVASPRASTAESKMPVVAAATTTRRSIQPTASASTPPTPSSIEGKISATDAAMTARASTEVETPSGASSKTENTAAKPTRASQQTGSLEQRTILRALARQRNAGSDASSSPSPPSPPLQRQRRKHRSPRRPQEAAEDTELAAEERNSTHGARVALEAGGGECLLAQDISMDLPAEDPRDGEIEHCEQDIDVAGEPTLDELQRSLGKPNLNPAELLCGAEVGGHATSRHVVSGLSAALAKAGVVGRRLEAHQWCENAGFHTLAELAASPNGAADLARSLVLRKSERKLLKQIIRESNRSCDPTSSDAGGIKGESVGRLALDLSASHDSNTKSSSGHSKAFPAETSRELRESAFGDRATTSDPNYSISSSRQLKAPSDSSTGDTGFAPLPRWVMERSVRIARSVSEVDGTSNRERDFPLSVEDPSGIAPYCSEHTDVSRNDIGMMTPTTSGQAGLRCLLAFAEELLGDAPNAISGSNVGQTQALESSTAATSEVMASLSLNSVDSRNCEFPVSAGRMIQAGEAPDVVIRRFSAGNAQNHNLFAALASVRSEGVQPAKATLGDAVEGANGGAGGTLRPGGSSVVSVLKKTQDATELANEVETAIAAAVMANDLLPLINAISRARALGMVQLAVEASVVLQDFEEANKSRGDLTIFTPAHLDRRCRDAVVPGQIIGSPCRLSLANTLNQPSVPIRGGVATCLDLQNRMDNEPNAEESDSQRPLRAPPSANRSSPNDWQEGSDKLPSDTEVVCKARLVRTQLPLPVLHQSVPESAALANAQKGQNLAKLSSAAGLVVADGCDSMHRKHYSRDHSIGTSRSNEAKVGHETMSPGRPADTVVTLVASSSASILDNRVESREGSHHQSDQPLIDTAASQEGMAGHEAMLSRRQALGPSRLNASPPSHSTEIIITDPGSPAADILKACENETISTEDTSIRLACETSSDAKSEVCNFPSEPCVKLEHTSTQLASIDGSMMPSDPQAVARSDHSSSHSCQYLSTTPTRPSRCLRVQEPRSHLDGPSVRHNTQHDGLSTSLCSRGATTHLEKCSGHNHQVDRTKTEEVVSFSVAGVKDVASSNGASTLHAEFEATSVGFNVPDTLELLPQCMLGRNVSETGSVREFQAEVQDDGASFTNEDGGALNVERLSAASSLQGTPSSMLGSPVDAAPFDFSVAPQEEVLQLAHCESTAQLDMSPRAKAALKVEAPSPRIVRVLGAIAPLEHHHAFLCYGVGQESYRRCLSERLCWRELPEGAGAHRAHLVWTARRSELTSIWDRLEPWQLVNHFRRGDSLCCHGARLANLRRYCAESASGGGPRCLLHELLPRSYDLRRPLELQSFLVDFALTRAEALLRAAIQSDTASQHPPAEDCTSGSIAAASRLIEQALLRRDENVAEKGGIWDFGGNGNVSDCHLFPLLGADYVVFERWRSVLSKLGSGTMGRSREEVLRLLSALDKLPQHKEALSGIQPLWVLRSSSSSGCATMLHQELLPLLKSAEGRRWKVVVQKYVEDSLILSGRKCDVRLWALVSSWTPAIMWLHPEPCIRLVTQNPTLNFDIDGQSIIASASSVASTDVCDISLSAFFEMGDQELSWVVYPCEQRGLAKGSAREAWARCSWPRMAACAQASILATQKEVGAHPLGCFEPFCFNFRLDGQMRPWLLSVDASPDPAEISSPSLRRSQETALAEMLSLVAGLRDGSLKLPDVDEEWTTDEPIAGSGKWRLSLRENPSTLEAEAARCRSPSFSGALPPTPRLSAREASLVVGALPVKADTHSVVLRRCLAKSRPPQGSDAKDLEGLMQRAQNPG